MEPHYVCQKFKKFIKKLEYKEIRFHDLRHTHATLLLEADTHQKKVSERLGHSSVAITMDLYSHVLPNVKADEMQKLEVLFE
jgi:integrase